MLIFSRRNLLLALAGAVLLGSGYAAGRAELRRARQPQSVTEAVARLEAKGLAPNVVAVDTRGGSLALGCYLCAEPGRKRERLQASCFVGRPQGWEGVVLIRPFPRQDAQIGASLREWGDRAEVVGGVLIYGDEAMVRELAKELR